VIRKNLNIDRRSMAQVFRPSANTLSKASIIGAILLLGVLGWFANILARSDYVTDVGLPQEQPVPFSHKHHVGDVGLDCRYCHTSVETAAFAGIPPTETCMSCHAQLFTESPMLEPVRASFRNEKPIEWNRVHALPDYVYFSHSIHLNKGVGCSTCHGRVDRMPLMWRESRLQMEWCLECHRAPERFVRPRDQVFSMDYQPPENQLELGRKLVAEYRIQKLTDCYTCHR
jgi:hypothetical protein